MHTLIIRRVIIGSWGLISDVDHKALWGFPTLLRNMLVSSCEITITGLNKFAYVTYKLNQTS